MSVTLPGASLQFQDPRESSEGRARLGWAATCPSSTPNKGRPLLPGSTEVRPAFSLLSLSQPRGVLTPEYFWGQEVAQALNSWIDSENDQEPRGEKNPKKPTNKKRVYSGRNSSCVQNLTSISPGCQMVDVFSLQIR